VWGEERSTPCAREKPGAPVRRRAGEAARLCRCARPCGRWAPRYSAAVRRRPAAAPRAPRAAATARRPPAPAGPGALPPRPREGPTPFAAGLSCCPGPARWWAVLRRGDRLSSACPAGAGRRTASGQGRADLRSPPGTAAIRARLRAVRAPSGGDRVSSACPRRAGRGAASPGRNRPPFTAGLYAHPGPAVRRTCWLGGDCDSSARPGQAGRPTVPARGGPNAVRRQAVLHPGPVVRRRRSVRR
jgi:hypothetical protein